MTGRHRSTSFIGALATICSVAACGPPDFYESCRSACHHLIDDCYSQVSMPDVTYDEGSCEADCANPITWCDAGAIYACVERLDCSPRYIDLASCFSVPGCTTVAGAGPVQGTSLFGEGVELDPEPPGQLCLASYSPVLEVSTLSPGRYYATQENPGSNTFFVGATFGDAGSIALLANDGMNIAGTFDLNVSLSGDAGTCLLRGNFEVPAEVPYTPAPTCGCVCPSAQEQGGSCSSGGGEVDRFLLPALVVLGLRVRRRRRSG